MTLYILFEALRDHRVTLDDPMPVSAHAAAMEPVKLYLRPGTTLTVQQAILGMVTLSANDAAAVTGEYLGGTEDRFAQMMTLRAHSLGMRNTIFGNASGLPDPDQWTTARDMATLASHLIRDFPGDYHYFSTPRFVFRGRVILNHDTELRAYPGADGLKTGYIDSAGCNLVTSAVRDNVRLVGVVLGAASAGERDAYMSAQLDQGYEEAGVPVLLAHATPHPLSLVPATRAVVYRSTVRAAMARGRGHEEVALARPPLVSRRPTLHPVAARHVLHPPPMRVAAHAIAGPVARARTARLAQTTTHAITHTVAHPTTHLVTYRPPPAQAFSCVRHAGKRVCTPVKRVASR
jgi:D-alanyl-D-alanine carboxypeptidase